MVYSHNMMVSIRDWRLRARMLMKARRITQEELAERANCTQGAIGHWLNGRRTADIDVIQQIADALGIPAIQLLSDDICVLSEREKNLVRSYQLLSADQKTIVDGVILTLKSLPN